MVDTMREHLLEALIVDLMAQGLRGWEEIQSATGMSDDRCVEMQSLIQEVWDAYYERNGVEQGGLRSERVDREHLSSKKERAGWFLPS